MASTEPYRIKTISAYHQRMGLPSPEHPLISVINFEKIKRLPGDKPISLLFDFYSIALKRNSNASVKYKYGQQEYDFNEGMMFFMSPGQVFSIEADGDFKHSGWMLLVHPDFLWNTPLAKKIRQYEYFSYSVHEALHLSEKEESMVAGTMQNIAQEYHSNIDKFSQGVMIAQLELLLTYAERFYHRQFITRKIVNHKILNRLEDILAEYFNADVSVQKGLPTVQYIAETLNVSSNYLSGLLKVLTGQSTQQHIHDKLIEKAKEKLSTTDLSVSEIAYELGFEHPQSFSKLFRTKTNLSPLDFRQSFQLRTRLPNCKPLAKSVNKMFNQFRNKFPFDNEKWANYTDSFKQFEVPAKTILLKEGEISKKVFFVEKGCIRAWFNNDGKDVTFQFFFENSTVASIESFRKTIPSLVSIETIEPSILWYIHKKDMEMIIAAVTEVADLRNNFIDAIFERTFDYMKHFFSFIKDTPLQRYENLLKDKPQIVQRVPQHYIASYLGISTVHLSRIKSKLAKEKRYP